MDHIIQALQRVKGGDPSIPAADPGKGGPSRKSVRDARLSDVELSISRLESMRIIAHDVADPRSRSFDLMRTQILQTMNAEGWRVLGVTSPTAECGKTFTAINLALSVARQAESAPLLVDMDLKKPQVAQRLGIDCRSGVRALLEGRATLDEAITYAAVGGIRLGLVPCERPSSRSSDWIGSSRMASALSNMRAEPGLKVIILDLPPMLSGDEVVSILPQVDCVVVVAALGTTTTVELKECANLMRSTPLIRVVLNKVPDMPAGYNY
jgi:protein-tyrosine kinase